MALLTKAANGRPDGALAQLVERYTGSVEVRGSTPLGSTNLRHTSCCPYSVTLNLFQGLYSELSRSKMLKQVQHDSRESKRRCPEPSSG